MMTIYDKQGNAIISIVVDDDSYRYREICGEHYARLQFSLAERIDISVGAYVDIEGERYTLLDPENITINNTEDYEYVVIFDAEQAKMKLYMFKNVVDHRLTFTLTAKPEEHLQHLVENMAIRNSAWTMGECISGAEVTISYDHMTCYEALQLMAAELNTEWEVVGNTIHLRRVEYNRSTPITLAYGRGKGFTSGVSRENRAYRPISILYIQGSERNIDPSKYGSQTLLLPKGQSISYDGLHFSDEPLYNASKGVEYVSSVLGDGVTRYMPTDNIAEGSLDCTEIYPMRVGRVTAAVEVNADKHLWGVVDDTIPDNLDYWEHRIAGEQMIMKFESGMLAGREFVVSRYYHNQTIGDKRPKRFELVPQAYDGIDMPDEASGYVPAVGDQYAIFGISLPEAYICDNATKSGASWDMMRKAIRELAAREKPQYTYHGTIDRIWMHNNWDSVGSRMSLGNCVMYDGTLMRIESVNTPINDRYGVEVTFGDVGKMLPVLQTTIRAMQGSDQRNIIMANMKHAELKTNEIKSLAQGSEVVSGQVQILVGNDPWKSVRDIANEVYDTSYPTEIATATQRKRMTTEINPISLVANILYDWSGQTIGSLTLPSLGTGDSAYDNRWMVRVALLSSDSLTIPFDVLWKDGVAPRWSSWCIADITFTKDVTGMNIMGEYKIYR